MDLRKMMKQAQEMQSRLQRELEDLVIDASVGGGMVKVQMSGSKQLLKVTIDPEVLDPDDLQMLEDLLLSAVNEAARKVDESLQQKLGSIPGMPQLPGLS